MTRPLRLPTVQSAHDNHEKRIFDLERRTRADQTKTRPGAVVETAFWSYYGTIATTTAADATAFRPRVGGTISAIVGELSTAGSSSTVVTVYKNGASIGTVTLASSDTEQTDAITPVKVTTADKVTARVTTAGTSAAGLSVFVDVRAS